MDIQHSAGGVQAAPVTPWLRESEEKYRALFEAIDEGFCVVEVLFDAEERAVDYRFLEVNPAFVRTTGLENPIGRRMRELAPRHEEYWFESYGRIARTGVPEHFERHAAALGGRWYDVCAFRIGPAEQRHVGILFRDITRRVQMDEALRRSEQRFRRAFEIETVGVIFFDPKGPITDANDAFLRMSGYTRDDIRQGRVRWDIVTPPEWMPHSLKAISELTSLGHTVPYEKEYLRPDGSRWWGLFAASLIDENTGVEFIIDITDQKRADHALKETRHALERNNEELERIVQERTAKLRDLVTELHHVSYAMVHDMRAPLRAMRGFAELLETMEDKNSPTARDYRRRIVLAAERLDDLITDALNYTRVLEEGIQFEPVDLHVLVHEIIQTYPNLSAENAEITVEGHLPTVNGNRSLLTQCFSNLLGNAVKFVAPGVRPRVRLWQETLSDEEGKPSCVRIWVEDNGIGIRQDAQERVFQIFQRIHEGYPGTGIGLAIVRKVAERMGGSVGVESEPGRGSRFWVNLPLKNSEALLTTPGAPLSRQDEEAG